MVISNHASPNLWNTPLPIPLIWTIPVLQNWAYRISPVVTAMATCHQGRGLQWKYTNAERQTRNALATGKETTNSAFEWIVVSRNHITWTPAITEAMSADRFIGRCPWMYISKTSHQPSMTSTILRLAGQYAVRIGDLRKPIIFSNPGWDSTSLNCLEIKSNARRSCLDVMAIRIWHRQTRFGLYHPSSPGTKRSLHNAGCQCSYLLGCNEQHYITVPTQETGTSTPGSIYLHREPQLAEVWPTVPVLGLACFIGLHGQGLTPSKIDNFSGNSSH